MKCLPRSVCAALPILAAVAMSSFSPAEPTRQARNVTPLENPNFNSRVDMTLTPFALSHVRLLDGRINDELEINRKYLHEGAPKAFGDIQFDPTTVLYLYRKVAGLPSPGHAMGHTDQPNSGRAQGQFSGHVLSALAMMYASTGDQELKKRSDEIIAGLAEVQASYGDGYLSAWPKSEWDKLEDMEHYCHDVPYYCQHKLMAGLWDQYRLAGSTRALDILIRCADWFVARYKRQSPELIHYVQHGFENGGMMEMYLNLYGHTGNQDYLMAALAMGKPDWFERLAKGDDGAIRVHGNVHLPLVIGLARHYEVTGDTRSRDQCLFFWERIALARSYASGGSTVNEGWPPVEEMRGTISESTVESCTVYNMLKLTRHLLCWRGDARYGDYYERNYFNHILGSMGTSGAIKTYCQPLAAGSHKLNHGPTSCCYGTGAESFSKLGDSIYFHSPSDLFVNLFIASRLDWSEKGVVLTQETRFPEEDTMAFTVEAPKPSRFALNFRVPGWATQGIQLRVNGAAVNTDAARPESWFRIEREWASGDRVQLRIPMRLHTCPLPGDPRRVAIMYGPLVLAGELDENDFREPKSPPGGSAGPVVAPPASENGMFVFNDRLLDELVPAKYYFTGDPEHPDRWITRMEPDRLVFRTVGQPQDVTLKPYNVFLPKPRGSYSDLIDTFGLDLSLKPKEGMAERQERTVLKEASAKPFAVYWVLARDPEDSPLREIRSAHGQWLDLKARLVDLVFPRHRTAEVPYRNQRNQGGQYHSWGGWSLILAGPGSEVSWDMKVLPDRPMTVGILYSCRQLRPVFSGFAQWCNCPDVASFDLLVNGQVIATRKPDPAAAWKPFEEFPVPPELTRDRETVTVTLKPHPNAHVRIYGCMTAKTHGGDKS